MLDSDGKVAIVTGATSGIGLEVALALADLGAEVVATGRSKEKMQEAATKAQVQSQGDKVGTKGTEKEPLNNSKPITVASLELTDFRSIEAFAREVKQLGKPVQYIFMNAGVAARPFERLQTGLEATMASNHFGHFKLFMELEPMLVKQKEECRVIFTSSRAHKFSKLDIEDLNYHKHKFGEYLAYADSKLANLLTAKEMHKRYASHGIFAYSVHPGVIPTPIFRNLPLPIRWVFESPWPMRLLPLGRHEVKSARQGATSLLWAALAPELAYSGGAYIKNCHVSNTLTWQAEDGKLAHDLWQKS